MKNEETCAYTYLENSETKNQAGNVSSANEARIEEPAVGQIVLCNSVGVKHSRIFCRPSEHMKKMGRLEFSQDPAQWD